MRLRVAYHSVTGGLRIKTMARQKTQFDNEQMANLLYPQLRALVPLSPLLVEEGELVRGVLFLCV